MDKKKMYIKKKKRRNDKQTQEREYGKNRRDEQRGMDWRERKVEREKSEEKGKAR